MTTWVGHAAQMVCVVMKPGGRNWSRENRTQVQHFRIVTKSTACLILQPKAFLYVAYYTLRCSTFHKSACIGCVFICCQHNIIYCNSFLTSTVTCLIWHCLTTTLTMFCNNTVSWQNMLHSSYKNQYHVHKTNVLLYTETITK
jgi:hypothetical protein